VKRCLRCEHRFEALEWRCPACRFAPAMVQGFPAFADGLLRGDVGYDDARFEVLARCEDEHFWFRSRAKLILWALHRHFPRAQCMLEIGCGTGSVLRAVNQSFGALRLTGSDVFSTALAIAARRAPAADFLQVDARRLPYRDEFDVIAAFDVIEHIDEDERVLREMYAACRPGGGIIVTVPQHEWLWSHRDVFGRHRRRYVRRDLLRKISQAGFERMWVTSFVTLLLPLMVISRLRQKKPQAFDPSTELDVGGAANAILASIMAFERLLVAAGATLPVGGSPLAVAHKPRTRT
jgi:ubiquinone/menaquinone biosynthesis C-methylase UbiE